jgi:hypothetical protein
MHEKILGPRIGSIIRHRRHAPPWRMQPVSAFSSKSPDASMRWRRRLRRAGKRSLKKTPECSSKVPGLDIEKPFI